MTLQAQRLIGATMAIVAILSLVIAALVQPMSEWGTWGFVLAAIVLIFMFIGLLAVVSKNPRLLTGRRPPDRSSAWSTVAVVAVGIAVVLMVIGGFVGGWTAQDVLQVGLFASVWVMFVGMLRATRAS